MRVVAAVMADLESSPIGTRSRLLEPLAGEPVLRRTVTRLVQVKGLESVHVLVPSSQHSRVAELLKGLPAVVNTADWPVSPHALLVQTARKWALGNWRGGVAGTCAFDESFHTAGLHALVGLVQAEGVMVVPAHAALLNVDLSQRMLEHFQEHGQHYRMTFSQSPPGLTPFVVATPLLAELEQAGYPPGMVLGYNPAAPEPDLIGKPMCYQVPTAVACTSGRLLADMAESFAMCEAAIETLGEDLAGDPLAICRFVTEYRGRHMPALPGELEIELTTEDALPGTAVRPRGQAVPARGPLDLGLLENVLRQVAQRDDSLAVLGGFGDPLCHGQWAEAVRLARRAGVFGISVQTTGKRLAQVGPQAVLADPPDLLVVWLDAATEDVYGAVHGESGYEQAAEAILALEQGRREHRQLKPLIVPAMTKAAATVRDMEAFVDSWVQRVGSCWVEGYSSRAGQCDRLEVASMAPPGRSTCRRLRSRMMMLADGQAVACDQDYRGLRPLGDLRQQTLSEIWQGEAMQRLRELVPRAASESDVLCEKCEEWARP